MVVWLSLSWLLLVTLIWLRVVLSRDFTLKDIINLHPSATPYPGGFKCFTCEDAEDNYSCNRWAPDQYCPKDTRFCYTRHQMNSGGESMSVTKRCAARDECASTGCVEQGGYMVCISCCEGNICNLPVPWNLTMAVFSTKSLLNQESRVHPSCATSFSIFIIIFTLNLP
ncbi:ly6/PLAUR domain-containing protein 6 [Pygocentrus nattereri]|uniref:ly6/PLAUR domain-containing protein 6 n=1 Tax=Pygocentrus nattereri TaxID=42514 RepID=UPI000814A937|nr:ly6/PLAUR domain-containing protein 6 [Pygocentrus nattereri]XP_037392473.1 ly6/PLAUR domain-containing protein 6 [Pygocentrus nattereri]